MPNHGAARQGLAGAIAAELGRWYAGVPWARRRAEHARLAVTELDIRRLDERIDMLLEILAQLCDYSGQFDAAAEFRALSCQPSEPAPALRLIQGS